MRNTRFRGKHAWNEYVAKLEAVFPEAKGYKYFTPQQRQKWRKKMWEYENPELARKLHAASTSRGRKKKWLVSRQEVLQVLGGKCVCCGETTEPFLTLDHIDIKQGVYDKKNKRRLTVYQEVITSGFDRSKYRILCWNCNCATRFGRVCPHNLAEVEAFLEICHRMSHA